MSGMTTGDIISRPAQEWSAAGHATDSAAVALLGEIALALVVAAYAFLVARAIVRRKRYRAGGVLAEADLRAVHDGLVAAERRTVGEILVVVLERSDRHPEAAWLAALCALVLGSIGLTPWLPWSVPGWVLLAQLALGALGYASARLLPDFARFFVSEARAHEVVEEQALQEFHNHGLFRTEGRTGVLLFVSLFERRALVLGDEGIHARVGDEHWTRTTRLVLDGIRSGSLRDGLVAGIASAGAVLAEHFPVAAGDRNELPDRVIVRRE